MILQGMILQGRGGPLRGGRGQDASAGGAAAGGVLTLCWRPMEAQVRRKSFFSGIVGGWIHPREIPGWPHWPASGARSYGNLDGCCELSTAPRDLCAYRQSGLQGLASLFFGASA
jgi:hypothetical protein